MAHHPPRRPISTAGERHGLRYAQVLYVVSKRFVRRQAAAGEFMAQYARCIMTGVPFDFTQDDIPRMRNRHALLIAQTEVAPAHRK